MSLKRLSLLTLLMGMSAPVQAVTISEVAWMGSQTSANHEWIELYNADTATSVDDWTLSDGMNLSISLSGTIPANSYVVLERNRSDGGSVVGTPFLTYTGALVNSGATLSLRRADGSLVDQVAGGENWQNIGGDNTTKETAQYTQSGWVTASPTPGTPNATTGTTPSTATSSTNNQVTSTNTTSGSQTVLVGSSVSTNDLTKRYSYLPWELDLSINAPATVQINQPFVLRADAEGLGPTHLNSLVYHWNLGDLTTTGSDQVTHTYQYPGTYIVSLYATYRQHEAVVTKSITAVPVRFSLARVLSGDLQLYNDATYEVDISGFSLKSGGKTIVFPPRSYLAARSTLTINAEKLPANLPVILYDSAGHWLASSVAVSAPLASPITQQSSASIVHRTPSTSRPASSGAATQAETRTEAFRFATGNTIVTNTTPTTSETVSISTTSSATTTPSQTSSISNATSTSPESVPSSRSWLYGVLILIIGLAIVAIILFPTRSQVPK